MTTSTASNASGHSIVTGHASSIQPLEADVLAEYARLTKNLDELAKLAGDLSLQPPEILERLRPLEQRLGLVLTLFKASVWATFVAQEAREEQEAAKAMTEPFSQGFEDDRSTDSDERWEDDMAGRIRNFGSREGH